MAFNSGPGTGLHSGAPRLERTAHQATALVGLVAVTFNAAGQDFAVNETIPTVPPTLACVLVLFTQLKQLIGTLFC